MKPSLIHHILRHLYYEDAINQQQIDITDFLKKIRDEDDDRGNNFNRIVMALNRINETHMASYNCSPNYSRLNEVAGGRLCTLENTQVNMSFTLEGWQFIKEFISQNEQNASTLATNKSILAANESLLTTNQSILSTNASVAKLNEMLPDFYKRQLRLTRITMVMAAISLLAVAVSA